MNDTRVRLSRPAAVGRLGLVLTGLVVWVGGCGPANPPDPSGPDEIAARIQKAGEFRSVTLTRPAANGFEGEAVHADGTAYDLTVDTRQERVVTFRARSREAGVRREQLEKLPETHLGLRDAVLTAKGDGRFEGTGVSQDGARCEFTLTRQAAPPQEGKVAYDFRVRRPGADDRSGTVQLTVDTQVRSGSFRW